MSRRSELSEASNGSRILNRTAGKELRRLTQEDSYEIHSY
jgi:hypothetical protein